MSAEDTAYQAAHTGYEYFRDLSASLRSLITEAEDELYRSVKISKLHYAGSNPSI